MEYSITLLRSWVNIRAMAGGAVNRAMMRIMPMTCITTTTVRAIRAKSKISINAVYPDDGGELLVEEIGLYWVKQGDYGKGNKEIQYQNDMRLSLETIRISPNK